MIGSRVRLTPQPLSLGWSKESSIKRLLRRLRHSIFQRSSQSLSMEIQLPPQPLSSVFEGEKTWKAGVKSTLPPYLVHNLEGHKTPSHLDAEDIFQGARQSRVGLSLLKKSFPGQPSSCGFDPGWSRYTFWMRKSLARMSYDYVTYGDRFNSCQVIYSQFGLAIHQNDHQARRRFVEWAQNEIAVVPDFHKRILLSDEAHFWLNGYVNKQNCRIWSEANPQVYVETPLHPEKLTVWCALWAGGILLQKR
ncbi:transposable element Tc3 transposase [Trichonephila clavipes]|nr:transposable element Tc3 transposase [Trichonephila clavipes]